MFSKNGDALTSKYAQLTFFNLYLFFLVHILNILSHQIQKTFIFITKTPRSRNYNPCKKWSTTKNLNKSS